MLQTAALTDHELRTRLDNAMPPQPETCRLAHNAACVKVNELTGFDEQAVRDVSTATALELLDRLLQDVSAGSWRAAQLTASDRDRLLAAVYRVTYGPRIDSTPRCTQCGSFF